MKRQRLNRKDKERIEHLEPTMRAITEIRRTRGNVFSKEQWGDGIQNMSYVRLEDVLFELQALFGSAPRTSDWREQELSARITASLAKSEVWTVRFGFPSWSKAHKFNRYVCRNKYGTLSAAIKCKKKGMWPAEVKVWQPNEEWLAQMIQRDNSRHLVAA